ncbi:MAG TPA: DUF4058 family protein [Pirellulales bacterium]|nr:DUF4058 family protein [Pirellulales bacterium]
MRSPFPGMDPYLEALGLWEDFHHDLITEIKGAISAVLPEWYVVRAGERSYIVLSAPNGEHQFLTQPDVGVARLAGAHAGGSPGAAAATAMLETAQSEWAPIAMRALVETEYREGFLEIRELRPQRKLVTCVEALSPSNKRVGTPGWLQYTRKRQAYLEGAANFVEIDLLRAGRRMPMEDEWPDSPYYLLVSRKQEAPRCTVWRAHYLRPLPPIFVPLAPPDADITLALQPLVEAVYARSRYDRDIDFRRPLDPPLSPAETTWLHEQLPQPP